MIASVVCIMISRVCMIRGVHESQWGLHSSRWVCMAAKWSALLYVYPVWKANATEWQLTILQEIQQGLHDNQWGLFNSYSNMHDSR
jgi:hypothetical protein